MLKWNIQDRPIWKSEIVVIFLNQVIGFIINHLVLVLSLQLYQLYQRKPWSRRCKYQRLWFMVLEEKHSSQHAHEQGAETSWNQQQRSSSNNVQYNCSKCCSCQLLRIWAFFWGKMSVCKKGAYQTKWFIFGTHGKLSNNLFLTYINFP